MFKSAILFSILNPTYEMCSNPSNQPCDKLKFQRRTQFFLTNCHYFVLQTQQTTQNTSSTHKKNFVHNTTHNTSSTHKKTNTMIPPRPSASSGFKIIGEYVHNLRNTAMQFFKVIITHSLFYNYLFHVQLISIG